MRRSEQGEYILTEWELIERLFEAYKMGAKLHDPGYLDSKLRLFDFSMELKKREMECN